ncbi:hypothetical protein PIB30_014347 [Stylosanthes scabra]|uniref:Uncharacterized protein n=1 Tax=Stylosanthes scabra TaxID=79078 RepID=A0ABU6S636_9FABA|nr:hypothetical protein [Stylosanthes scabra]
MQFLFLFRRSSFVHSLEILRSHTSGGSRRCEGRPRALERRVVLSGLLTGKLMDYSGSFVSLFKELGCIKLLAQRLQKEVQRVIGLVGENYDDMTLTGESSKHNANQLYAQKRLRKKTEWDSMKGTMIL